jgi:OmpA-OmpF porin, OOP family
MKFRHFLLLLLLLTGQVYSQTPDAGTSNYGLPKPNDFDRWSVGATFGVSHLLGDLLRGGQNNSRFINDAQLKPTFGLQVHYQVSHSIGIRARGLFTNISGSDDDYLDTITLKPVIYPNSGGGGRLYKENFKGPLTEGSLEMTYNFGNISFLNRNKNFHFVATLGLGLFNFDTKVTEDTIGSPLLRKSGNTSELMVPLSLGFKYKVSKFDIGMALEYRKTFTDNVDATVKTFSEFDNYLMLNFAVNYTFGKKNKAMEWVNPMEVVYNDLADMKEKIDILSGDKDKDGVSDLFDKDNSTAEGSKVYGDGTTVDTDGDGVPDGKDADPFTLKGAKVDANGQESDADGDGVADSRDLEPNTPQGSLVNFQGITLAKPGEFGKDGLSGSGSNGKNGTGFLPSVFFDLGSSVIKPIYNDRLLVIAKVLKTNPTINVKVSGNCDIKGSTDENNRLGQKRADAVKNHLIKQYGIDAARISTETKGESDPMASSINGMNRRVDFTIE